MITIYLAGAIRDDHYEEDVRWREVLIKRIERNYGMDVRILNPLGNKTFNPATHEWKVGGIRTQSRGIVSQDLWSVAHSDIVIANFTSLSQGYPSIGTLMEVGAAAANPRQTIIYSIMEPKTQDQIGNANKGVFKMHPFLEQVSAEIFPGVEELWAFLSTHLGMLTGTRPGIGGVVYEPKHE